MPGALLPFEISRRATLRKRTKVGVCPTQLSFICNENADLMPLNETDKSWIREAIRDAHKLHGRGKLTGFIKDWGATGAVVAVILFCLVQWNSYTEFRIHTGDRLNTIEAGLKEIKGGLAQQSLAIHASLSLAEFSAALPDLKSSIATSRRQEIKAPPRIVNDLAEKLSKTDKSAPDFWPTASELINYRSFLSAPQQYIKITFQMRDCDVHPARDMTIRSPQKDGSVEIDKLRDAITILQESCFLDLDEHNEIEDYVCHHCVVKYSGGPLTLKAPVEFKDCLFVFSINAQPPTPSGILLAQTLLSQNPQDVKIPAG